MKSTHVLAGSLEICPQTVRRTWPRKASGASQVRMESLEDRALFSVAAMGAGLPMPVANKLPAVQMPGGTQGIIAILIGL